MPSKPAEESKVDSSVKFEPLCKEFLQYYDDYCVAMDGAFVNRGEENLVLFGTSGAGKSTTVARLIKDAPASVFCEQLERESGQRQSMIAGVLIGHEVNSCTVVPTPYSIKNGIGITDMPGFAESQAQKKISIDILQKCYMTSVEQYRLLVVVDIGLIYQSKMQSLRDNYHKALLNLLGEEAYDRAVDHFYFLLTKPEKAEGKEPFDRKVKDAIFELVCRNADKDTAQFSKFLGRMLNHHRVVDLKTCTKHSLLADIKKMIKDGDDEAKGNHIPKFRVDHMDAGENKLNALCVTFVKEKALVKQAEFDPEIKAIGDVWVVQNAEMQERIDLMTAKKRAALENEEHLQAQLARVVGDIHAFPTNLKTFEDSLEAAEKRLVVSKEKLNIFRSKSVNDEFVNVRVDVAIRKGGLGRNQYTAEINADVGGDGSTGDVVLVMEYEATDVTLKAKVGRGQTMIPTSLKVVEDLDVPQVLFNSKTRVCRGGCLVDRPPPSKNDGVRLIRVKLDRLFKVYIFSTRPFHTMPVFRNLETEFEKEVRNEKDEISRIGQEIEDLKAKYEHDQREEVELKRQLDKTRAHVKTVYKEIESLLETTTNAIESTKSDVEALKASVIDWHGQELVCNVKKIIEVFKANRIHSEAGGLLEEIETKFRKQIPPLNDLLHEIEEFQNANREDFEKLLHESDVEAPDETDPFFNA